VSVSSAFTRRYRLQFKVDDVDGSDTDAQLGAVAVDFASVDKSVTAAAQSTMGVKALVKSEFVDIETYGDHCSDEVRLFMQFLFVCDSLKLFTLALFPLIFIPCIRWLTSHSNATSTAAVNAYHVL